MGILTVVAGLAVVGVSDILFSKQTEGSHTNKEKIAGDALILVGMLFTGFQVLSISDKSAIFIWISH